MKPGITQISIRHLKLIESIKGYSLEGRVALAKRSGVSVEAINEAMDKPNSRVNDEVRSRLEDRIAESEKFGLHNDYILGLKDALKLLEEDSGRLTERMEHHGDTE